MLVSDEQNGAIYRITYSAPQAEQKPPPAKKK